MRRPPPLTWIALTVTTGLAGIAPTIATAASFAIVAGAGAAATCADVAPAALARLALGEAIVERADVEKYDSARRELTLSRKATVKLVTNAADFAADEEAAPRGPLPDANGRAFVVTLDGKRELGGLVVARLEDLREKDQCPVLVMGPVLDGRLHLYLGRPRSHDELHEDFWKVFAEEGPAAALAPILPKNVVAVLSSRFDPA